MSEPKRIQRKRTKGWRMPEGAVYVGRPSTYGNPFSIEQVKGWPRWASSAPWQVVGPDGRIYHPDDDRKPIVGRAAAERHGRNLAARKAVDLFVEMLRIFEPEEQILSLRNKDLACWCPLDQPCHADVLLEFANQDAPAQPA
jgi:uncharacterized protein DUF4326